MNFITLMYVTEIMTMPGPVDPSVLTLQATHMSLAVWEGSTTQLVTRQYYQTSTSHWEVDDRVLEVVELVGFSYIHRFLGGGFRARLSSYHCISGEVEAGDSYLPLHGWRGNDHVARCGIYNGTAH